MALLIASIVPALIAHIFYDVILYYNVKKSTKYVLWFATFICLCISMILVIFGLYKSLSFFL